ncbi:MAG: hypothetical protein A2Z24_02845 [Candidatus Woykebacteria bacterium RBG_16_44_10]|uniref:Uncharacterized protein n=1 Tax=Candidatus Woykebacteria bacterium RBG_16_44_10 TaxID=1802597 RepID=A0A1G1WEH4_9BACT|nr:MAG: hypothetical protein A2Z24_02845 [Candidatus Woykebacteria bacterium RBG_16_44_10]
MDPAADPQQFVIEVRGDDGIKTTHQVTLHKDLYIRLTGGLKSPEELVRASFQFLLDKEPKESILQSFDLSQIQRFFPEYEVVISSQIIK